MSRVTGVGTGMAILFAAGLSTGPVAGQSAGAEDKENNKTGSWAWFDSGGGRLGVRLDEVDKDDAARLKLSDERGALVRGVDGGSPAEKAGLKEGDVILRYQGETVLSAAQLARMVRETPPGRTVTLEVSRGGASQKLSATVGEGHGGFGFEGDLGDFHMPAMPAMPAIPAMPAMPAIPPVPPLPRFDSDKWGRAERLLLREPWAERGRRRLGIEYQEISGQLAKYFKLEAEDGLLVTSVDQDGPAARAGIKAGDVILKLNGTAVRDGQDLRSELQRVESGQEASVTVQRDGKPIELKVMLCRPEERPKQTSWSEAALGLIGL